MGGAVAQAAEKACRKCGIVRPISDFHRAFDRKSGRESRCKHCVRNYQNKWRKNDRFRAWARQHDRRYRRENKERFRGYERKKRYGLTAADYARLVAQQGGHCASCGGDPGPKGLVVDHCHTKGHVRGLLCGNCNNGIGFFRDDPVAMERAAAYIRRSVVEAGPPCP